MAGGMKHKQHVAAAKKKGAKTLQIGGVGVGGGDSKQTICLNMIVRNESHVIQSCLEDVHEFIDTYVIVDTGSTDNTPEVIKKFFDSKGIRGEVIVHDFKTCTCHGPEFKKYNFFHFADNRTYALQKCRGKADYVMFMDADDCVEGKLQFPPKLVADQYYLTVRTDNNIYYKPLLIKNDPKLKWRWESGLHEFLEGDAKVTHRLMGDYAVVSRRLGNRNQDPMKYLKDVQFLEELIQDAEADSPLMVRYKYYYAQSLFDAKEYTRAIEVYTEVMNDCEEDKNGGKDRQFSCHFMVGRSHVLKGSSSEEIERVFLDCYMKHKHRAEPLFQLVIHFSALENYKKAYEYGSKGVGLSIPTNTVFYIDKSVYDYRLLDELVFAATQIGKYRDALTWSEKLLAERKYPDACHEHVMYNIEYLKTIVNKEGAKKQVSLKQVLDQPENKNKPMLCFYVGPSPMLRKAHKYGSELAVEYLAAELRANYNVFIASDDCDEDKVSDRCSGVFHIHSQSVAAWRFDVMIVSRYINYFVEFDVAAISQKTYVWLHDTDFHTYWNQTQLPKKGVSLVRNVDALVTGYITLSPWHKQYIQRTYGLSRDKVHVIGNGVYGNVVSGVDIKKKVPGRFIWVSDHQRGLVDLIAQFPMILREVPHAHLEIYRELPSDLVNLVKGMPYIKLKGHANNEEILEAFKCAEYWYYPTKWHETYCISALEAQLMGCICIASDLAALSTTVGGVDVENADAEKSSQSNRTMRGVLLKQKLHSEEYWKEGLDAIVAFEKDPERKRVVVANAMEWAAGQTWRFKAQEWTDLFDKTDGRKGIYGRLNVLKKFGFDPRVILDIGANIGDWNVAVQKMFPMAKITSFEANPDCGHVMKFRGLDSRIVLLGSENKENVEFYVNDECNTGASVYRELTDFYSDGHKSMNVLKMPMRRLDDVYDSVDGIGGMGAMVDLMKLDVQGAELQIMQGAKNILQNTCFVLLEVSVMKYNQGAPLIDEVIAFMEGRGFKVFDVMEPHYLNGCCLQVDILFLNNKKTNWAKKIAGVNRRESFWKVDHIYEGNIAANVCNAENDGERGSNGSDDDIVII